MGYNKIAYNNEFNKTHYDRVAVMLPAGMKDELKAAADAAGMSVNKYILTAIKEYKSK